DAAPVADAEPRMDAAPPGEGCAAYAGLDGDALRDRLHRDVQSAYVPIDPQADLGGNLNRYTTARHFMFTQVERRPGPGGQQGVECVYTGRFVATGPDEEPNHNDFNAEHVWPRSRMDGDRDSVLFSHHESDIHNLWPSDAGANSARGSFRFGTPVRDRVLDHSPSVLGTDASGDTVFEVRAARRGDIARTVLYYSVRWGLDLPATEEATVRAWHAEDPPDDLERGRNDAVEAIQGNRNPFIDCPELVERVDDFEAFQTLDGPLPAP
ncbi:MAG: endonuclease, partial [Myxococcales bacterium]|nr:endonuclease [Myxococcales bacterium]